MTSDIDFQFTLANDSEFRDQLAYALTPIVGTILTDNGDGTYIVDASEGDGGEITAQALDERAYSVGDFVWCILAFSSTDSALILGSHNPAPTRLETDEVRAAGTAGLKLSDTDGDLGVFVEDGGEVGIRHSAPTFDLHIKRSTNGAVGLKISNTSAGGAARARIILENDAGETNVFNLLPSTHATLPNAISIANDFANADVLIRATDGSNNIDLFLDGSAKKVGIGNNAPSEVLDVTGNVKASGLNLGNEVMSTYNEGTWTPAITSSGGGESVTYTTQAGQYTQIGNVLFYTARIVINTYSGGSGDLRLSLPTTVPNADVNQTPGTVYVSGPDLQAGTRSLAFVPTKNTSYGRIVEAQDNASAAVTAIGALAAGDSIIYSGFYFAG